MRCFLPITVIATILCFSGSARADNILFSEVAMESVFEKKGAEVIDAAEIADDESLPRVTGPKLLISSLKSAGFEATSDENKVSFKLRQGRWLLPLSMEVQIETDRIECNLALIKIENQPANSKSLLDLLAASDTADGIFFAYSSESKFLVLRSSLSNRSITPRMLREHIEKLGATAEENADSWSMLGKPSASPTASATPASSKFEPDTSSSAKTMFSLVGSWSASTANGDSFAIKVTSDSKFKLVHLKKGGKPTISQGTTTRSASSLTLSGDDGAILRCTVAQSSSDRFQLSILSSKGTVTTTLDFKKAK